MSNWWREATAPYDPITLFTPQWDSPEISVIQIGVKAIREHVCEYLYHVAVTQEDGMKINVAQTICRFPQSPSSVVTVIFFSKKRACD